MSSESSEELVCFYCHKDILNNEKWKMEKKDLYNTESIHLSCDEKRIKEKLSKKFDLTCYQFVFK